MEYRWVGEAEVGELAEMNWRLIRDEGHRNRMTVEELGERMRGFLRGEYRAVVFAEGAKVAGYALFRHEEEFVYLRQFYVKPTWRRRGVGRAAMGWLKEAWAGKRVRIEVLVGNAAGRAFWKGVGFEEYAVTMEWG